MPSATVEEEFLGLKLATKCKGVAFSEGMVTLTAALFSIKNRAENSSSKGKSN